ncbi:hypothetical protein FRY74_07025 [Vicingus serpentipes]|uniref:DUF6089 domain-containing protein n=1 Tax=Vicingus serpentipes TaxID=1926625 RepID=A0A5C6RU33_9FLAO|nr:DUF6089 family protein [Vicingus serpentipes]TXB65170.1 hypothetical protein FRY74_07025 [Vicingus serpentipes]
MQKRVYILAIFLFASLSGFSQYNVDYGFSLGVANYLGDIGGGIETAKSGPSDMKLDHTRFAIGGFYRTRFSQKFAFKGSLNYIRLSGDDSNTANPARRSRNLNFRNDMYELEGHLELYLFRVNDVGRTGRYSTDFNLYLFGGVGAFYSNPKGQNANGDWVELQPLQTEGVSYSKINFSIPAGLGFYYTIDRKYRLGLEMGWRTTFTDYIDDVSNTYANDYDGISNKTTQALLDKVNAENDVNNLLTNFDAGSRRGNPDDNDSYLTATVNFSWAIRGRSNFYKSKHNWVLGKNKRKRRKSRAKF